MRLARRLALLLLLLLPTAVGAEDDTFVSGGVKIRYRVQGQGDTAVLIHGFSAGPPGAHRLPEDAVSEQASGAWT